MKINEFSKLFNVKFLSEYLGVKPGTIYRWTHKRYIPHIKFGGRVRFDLKAVRQWVYEREIEVVRRSALKNNIELPK